jgi:hypothetical protein
MSTDADVPRFGHPRFYELLEEMAELHSRKNHDYAGTSDPLKNLRSCTRMGIEPFMGTLVRLQDKWSRLEQYANSRELMVKGEGVKDTLMDNAVYSLKQYRAYYSCPIRGAKGKDATIEDCRRNCEIARNNLYWLELLFPEIEWVAPAAHDLIVQRLLERQYVTIEQVLECDGVEQAACDFTVCHRWELSGGVDTEYAFAKVILKHPVAFLHTNPFINSTTRNQTTIATLVSKVRQEV